MDTGIHIGNKADAVEASLNEGADAIVRILYAGMETAAEQATIVASLQALTKLASVHDITISNSTVTGCR